MNQIGPIQLFAEIKRHEKWATYRGWDAESGRIVLVKIFTPANTPEEAALARFHQEAAIYASLNPPHVVRLVKFGVAENRPYLALEFVEGQNLRALLNQRSPLPNDIAITIALALLAGLAEIHRHGIIHRDLKPENIMIGHEGSVKICDFDLAIAWGKEQGAKQQTSIQIASDKHTTDNWQLTTGNLLFGSPGYFSPEAVLGETITTRSDLFALGIIFYEMFTGTRPFAAATVSGEINAVVRLPHLMPSKFNPAIPPEIEHLINRLLAKSPAERPESATEVWRQLNTQFRDGDSEQRAARLRRYLNEPQTYQSDGIVLPPKPPAEFKPRAKTIPWRMITATVLLLLFVALTYQQFFRRSQQVRNNQAPTLSQTSPKESLSISPDDSNRGRNHLGNLVRTLPPAEVKPYTKAPDSAQTSAFPEAEKRLPAPSSRSIVVRCVPWAYLFVNDDSIGQVPRAAPLLLAEGNYQFVFKKPKFPPIPYSVHVDSATADTLVFSLLEKVAQLAIKINPWAEIYLNGERREPSSEDPNFYLLPGAYRLKFIHPQLGEKVETIFLQAGEVRRLAVNMFQQTTRD